MNPTSELREALRKHLAAGVTDETLEKLKKQAQDIASELEEGLYWSMRDNFAESVSYAVQHMCNSAVERLLAGDEDALRYYLSCEKNDEDYTGWTGRAGHHEVIHGKLFESSPLELRRKIVDAYPELLKNERVLDLEAQTRSLVEQVRKLEAKRYELQRRLNEVLR